MTIRPNHQPLFSLITVVFNDLIGLQVTKDSILCQECTDFEWIIIDGGSSDGTKEFIERLGPRVSKWLSEKDTGIYDAMNKGLSLAEGTFTVFMNAGDSFRDSSTVRIVKDHIMATSPMPDVVFGGSTLILRNGTHIYRPPRDVDRYIWHGLPAYHQATYYKSSRLKATPYDLSYRICGDYYLVAKLYLQGIRPSYLNVSLVNFRVGDTSYRAPIKLIMEPYHIQKNILGLSLLSRTASMAKRLISLLAVALLSHPLARKYTDRIGTKEA